MVNVNTQRLEAVFKKTYENRGTAIISVSEEWGNVCVLYFTADIVLFAVQEEYPDYKVFFQSWDEWYTGRTYCRSVSEEERDTTIWWDVSPEIVYIFKN